MHRPETQHRHGIGKCISPLADEGPRTMPHEGKVLKPQLGEVLRGHLTEGARSSTETEGELSGSNPCPT